MTATLVRKRDAPATKARILAAAQDAFATIGYSQAGIREIAALAGTSPTLLIRYFGSKAGLFEAALSEAMRTDDIFPAERAGFGRYLAETFARPEIEIRPPAMIALAAGDPQAAAITARVAEDLAIRPFAAWLGGPDAHARSVQVFMLATSFVLYTRQLPVMPVARGIDPAMVDWLATSLQAIIDNVPYSERTDRI
jgi:AcrR family transcriptional regulator